MDRARDDVFSGTCLSDQEDRNLARGHALDLRHQAAHDVRSTDQRTDAIGIVELDAARSSMLDDDLRLSDGERRPRKNRSVVDAGGSEEGSIGRAEIGDRNAISADLQLEVIARHGVVGEDEIVVGGCPDRQRVDVRRVMSALVRPVEHADRHRRERRARARLRPRRQPHARARVTWTFPLSYYDAGDRDPWRAGCSISWAWQRRSAKKKTS